MKYLTCHFANFAVFRHASKVYRHETVGDHAPQQKPAFINVLATVIKLRRQALGFSQEDLAASCQLDRPYISLIEVGRKQPTLSVLLRLAEGLQYPLADFMGRVQQRYLPEKAAMRSDESIAAG